MADSAASWMGLGPNNKPPTTTRRGAEWMCLFVCLRNFTRWLGWRKRVETDGEPKWSGVQWRTDRCDFKKPDTTEPSQTKRHPLGEETRAWASGVESTMVMEKEQPGSSSCSMIMTGRDKRSI